jgi:hypothetical protein
LKDPGKKRHPEINNEHRDRERQGEIETQNV